MSNVSLALAKAHMNITGDADDELIQLYLDAAESYLANYTGRVFSIPENVPADLKLAILRLTSFYFEHREAVSFGDAMRIAPHGVLAVADAYRFEWFGEKPEGFQL